MAYSGLDKKRSKVTEPERSGKHGIAVDGIASPATPSNKRGISKPTPEPRMVPMPSYGEDPFALNPQLKGFSNAKTWRGSSHFPVNALRLKKRGPVIE